jgi:transposase-like protein
MPKQQRDSAVITLIRNGLTIRQISRLTGVARSTIARILK